MRETSCSKTLCDKNWIEYDEELKTVGSLSTLLAPTIDMDTKKFTRHFVTARFGNGKVETSMHSDGGFIIEIVIEGIAPAYKRTSCFYVSAEALAPLSLGRADLVFCLSRIAISQFQRQIAKAHPDQEQVTSLDLLTPQWNGDLSETEYRGRLKVRARIGQRTRI